MCENRRAGKEEDEDFRSENGLIISYLVVELFSKVCFGFGAFKCVVAVTLTVAALGVGAKT